jgi:hypothetical protein
MVSQAVPIFHVKRPKPLRWPAPSGSSTNHIPTKTASTLENVLTGSPIGGETKDQRDFLVKRIKRSRRRRNLRQKRSTLSVDKSVDNSFLGGY